MKMIDGLKLLEDWKTCIHNKTPHSSIRIGDSELAVLAHEEILSMKFVRRAYPFGASGIKLPNKEARNLVAEAVKSADYIGHLPGTDHWNLRPLYDMVAFYYDLKPKQIFDAFTNFSLSKMSQYYEAFKEEKVMIIGKQAELYKEVLERRYKWSKITGTIDCQSYEDVEAARIQMESMDYDLAIVCAGVPGKILTYYAKKQGKVGIDMGSAADTCIQSDYDGMFAWDWPKNPDYWGDHKGFIEGELQ